MIIKRLFWNLYALCYDSLNSFRPYQEMMGVILDYLRLGSGQKVLDAGCGTGNLEMRILQKNIDNLEIKAVDFSGAMLRRAEKKLAKDRSVVISEIDLNDKLPFPDNHFDRVVSVNVVHILKNPERAIHEFARVLAHGGKLIVVTLKEGYEMPLILKAHSHIHEDDAQWKTKNLLAWFRLVFRTFGFNGTAVKFIFVALFNKAVDREIKGFSRKELERIFFEAGLEMENSGLIYGDQEFIYVVRKSEVWIKLAKTEKELRDCFVLRKKIFVEEFGVVEKNAALDTETDEYDSHSFHFLVIENGEPIGTLRLIKATASGGARGLYEFSDSLDLDKALEFSRVSLIKEKRGNFGIFIKMLKYTHKFAVDAGYNYFCGTIRVSLLKFLKRLKWDIIFESEPFEYEKKWMVSAFIFPIGSNLKKIPN